MKRLAVLLCLIASPALAATTWYAGPPACNATAATCGDTDDSDRCCNPQNAIKRAVSGDTVIIHGGTYTGSAVVAVNGANNTFSLNVNKTNLIVKAATGETPIFDGGNTVNGCIVIQSSGNGSTIDGLTCSNHICGVESNRAGIIYVWSASGLTIKNNTINSGLPRASGEFACGTIRLRSTGTDNTLVENNTLTGHLGNAILVEETTGSQGIVIRGNSITENGIGIENPYFDPGRIFVVKSGNNTGPIVIYNNRSWHTGTTGDTPMIFTRESTAPVYAFNNICVNCASGTYGMFNTQDNDGSTAIENEYIFNNTATGTTQAGKWQDYFSPLRVRNNIFDGVGQGIRGDSSVAPGGGNQNWSTTTDKFTYNVVEHCAGSLIDTGHSPDPTGHVDVTGTVKTAGAQSSRDANNNLTAALGVATNDPIGQGAGVCSITAAGLTINCAVDINGTSRGSTWDAGADQYATAAPGGSTRRRQHVTRTQ